jgi:hypothetical protein
MLSPRNSHNDHFVDETLIGDKGNTLGAGQECDLSPWILDSQILQKGQFHYDVAEIPIFNDEYALHFCLHGTADGGAQPIHKPHERAQNGFD